MLAQARRYIPEVHDAHPGNLDAINRLLDVLPDPARSRAAVFVVPCYEHAEPVRAATPFAAFLAAHASDVVLHGFAHSTQDTFWNRAWFGTVNHAEFLRLSAGEAARLVTEGADLLAAATGTRPRWFCPPRWQYGRATAAALDTIGWPGRMYRDHLVICEHHASGTPARRTIHGPSVWFDDGRRVWRQVAASRLRRRRVRAILAGGQLFRLVLHPADLAEPGAWTEIRALLASLDADGWHPVSLSDAAGQTRDAAITAGDAAP